MKKNEHYFPTMEFFKDEEGNNGWKRRSWQGGREGREGSGASNLTAEAMDEGDGGDEGGNGGD